jgi:hypothetical protein
VSPTTGVLPRAWLRGLLSHVPGFDALLGRRRGGGGTSSARYCYSVWLRHLVMAHRAGLPTAPQTVAELGPGDSVGVGLAALLTGSERYWALDVISYANPQRNLEIFDGLVELLRARAPIPDETDLVEVQPALETYAFPGDVLTDERLAAALAPDRIARLRQATARLGSAEAEGDATLTYMVSWQDSQRIRPASVDLILSQAVLEHVEDIEATYRAIRAWLRPGGVMSHQIDFRCHGTTAAWNGHWGVTDLHWKIAKGRREYFLNREPCSRHLQVIGDLGFRIVRRDPQRDESGIGRGSLIPRFRHVTDEDLRTCGLFIQAVKP